MFDAAKFLEEASPCYPAASQVDAWAEQLLARSQAVPVTGEPLVFTPIRLSFGNSPNTLENRYIRFTAGDGRRPF